MHDWTEPPTVPTRVKRAWTIGITVGLVLLATFACVRSSRDSPENIVYDYFAAILDGDVDTALDLMDDSEGLGSTDFLTPEAVASDWQLLSVADVGPGDDDSDYRPQRVMRVKIGGPAGYASGKLLVSHDEDFGWRVDENPIRVTVTASPLDYLQVNGYQPKPQATQNSVRLYRGYGISLLPGLYRFYEDIPGVVRVDPSPVLAALPSDPDDTDEHVLTPGKVVAEKKTVASARHQLKKLLTECVTATVARPGNCPFGAGSFVNTPEGQHVEELRDLRWELERPPKFTMHDARYRESADGHTGEDWAFEFEVSDPEVLTLRGKGIDTDGDKVDFEVPCRVDLSNASAAVQPSGMVTLWNTGLPEDDDGPLTCGTEL